MESAASPFGAPGLFDRPAGGASALYRVTEADRGTVERPLLAPHPEVRSAARRRCWSRRASTRCSTGGVISISCLCWTGPARATRSRSRCRAVRWRRRSHRRLVLVDVRILGRNELVSHVSAGPRRRRRSPRCNAKGTSDAASGASCPDHPRSTPKRCPARSCWVFPSSGHLDSVMMPQDVGASILSDLLPGPRSTQRPGPPTLSNDGRSGPWALSRPRWTAS